MAAFLALSGGMASAQTLFSPTPVHSWTGFYVGGHIGWREVEFTPSASLLSLPFTTGREKRDGSVHLGGHVGYNYLLPSGFLIGLEGDGSYARAKIETGALAAATRAVAATPGGSVTTINAAAFQEGAELQATGTVRGRLGYTFGRWLVYGTGGVAFGDVTLRAQSQTAVSVTFTPPGATTVAATPLSTGRKSDVALGYAAGGGLEYALWDGVTVRGEYIFSDFGRRSLVLANGAVARVDVDSHTARAGFTVRY